MIGDSHDQIGSCGFRRKAKKLLFSAKGSPNHLRKAMFFAFGSKTSKYVVAFWNRRAMHHSSE